MNSRSIRSGEPVGKGARRLAHSLTLRAGRASSSPRQRFGVRWPSTAFPEAAPHRHCGSPSPGGTLTKRQTTGALHDAAAPVGTHRPRVSVLECGGPPPLFPEAVPHWPDDPPTPGGTLTKRQTAGALHDASRRPGVIVPAPAFWSAVALHRFSGAAPHCHRGSHSPSGTLTKRQTTGALHDAAAPT
jgi:hypothetical protein